MMNNNKILTVSYGTFSCTLEGFDDSFGTMKAIAEYFRDLASDDRYFGAEPPQPDAEMLARIAQREVARKVEAHERDGKIVLSALEENTSRAAAPAALAGLALAQGDGTVEPAPTATETQTKDAVAPHPTVAPDVAQTHDETEVEIETEAAAANEETPADTIGDTAEVETAADHSPRTDAQANTQADAATEETAQDNGSDDAVTVVDHSVSEKPHDDLIAAQPQTDIVPGQPDEEVEAFFEQAEQAPAEAPGDIQPTAEVPFDAPASDAPDSIAAKLQRIRAVVAQHDDEEDDDFSEDEHANAEQSGSEDEDAAASVVADARHDIEDALEADEAAELEAHDIYASDEEADEIGDILRRLGSDTIAEAETASETTADAPTDTSTSTSDAIADLPKDDIDDGIALDNVFEDDTVPASLDAEQPDAVDAEAATANVVATEGLQVAATPIAENVEAVKAHRARVIKVKRADLQAAIDSGNLEEYDEDSVDDKPDTTTNLDDLAPARTANTSLSAEDADDLTRELAALEAEMHDVPEAAVEDAELAEIDPEYDTTEDQIAASLEDLEEADQSIGTGRNIMGAALSSARAKLPKMSANQDADVSRLLAEADSQMDEPESATRRDAFAHLRAAVAAKKADDALGGDEPVSQDDAYRNDLADVVRPRRPVAGETLTRRPREGRPAPLKLVAEQRIDVEDSLASTGPVSPRRVSRAPEPVAATDSGFAEFAAEAGATKLPDLLEAAAAYLSFVEGHDKFSRPQLMNKVRQVGVDGFTREDTLRSFGKLLREGKIEKIKTGQFSASEDIGFQPSRQAG